MLAAQKVARGGIELRRRTDHLDFIVGSVSKARSTCWSRTVIMHGCSVVLFTMYMLTDVWLKTHCVKQSVRLCTWSNGLFFVVFILHGLISLEL